MTPRRDAPPRRGTVWLAHASGRPDQVTGPERAAGVIPWAYLGQDYLRLLAWQRGLEDVPGRHERVPITRHLDDTAHRLRRPYLELLADMGRRYDSLAWWTSRVAERNTMVSPLFLHCCHLHVGVELLERHPGSLGLVSESWAALHALARHARARHRPVRWITPSQPLWRVRLRRYANLARHAGRFLRHRWSVARLARDVKRHRADRPQVSDRPTVLLRTFVDDACLREDGTFRDRQLVGVSEWLEAQHYEVLTLPVLYNVKRSYRDAWRWLHDNRRRFVNADEYYRFSDLLFTLGVGLRQAFLPRGRVGLDDLDVTPLFEEERLRFALDRDVLEWILVSRLPRRLKRAGVRVDLLIEGYENMLPERGTIAGFRRHWPAVKIVGFQHPLPAPLLLCHFMTSVEASRAPLPDRIVCNGQRSRDALLRDGLDPQRVVEGPALRYAHLAGAAPRNGEERACVLVALPLELGSAVELLSKVLAGLGDATDLAVKVKPHPMMSLPDLMHHCRVDRMPDHFEFVDGSMDTWLARARLIISSGSAVLYEAVAAGVPAIVVGREGGLNLNPLAGLPDPSPVCHRPEQIHAETRRLWNLTATDRDQRRQNADDIRRTSFNPTTPDAMRVFIDGLVDAPPASTTVSAE